MRESNVSFPPQNRAVVTLTHLLYDRRALDTRSPLAILNNLTSLTYLTSTSPRIREILTADGGLERLLDILRDSLLPRENLTPHDLWGLNGPPTARVISVDRGILLRHSLAFQCVVNIGVRGSEAIRTRVVQAGALDLVSQILESWLKQHGVHIFASQFGSQMAIDAHLAGLFPPDLLSHRGSLSSYSREHGSGSRHTHVSSSGNTGTVQSGRIGGRGSIGTFMASFTRRRGEATTGLGGIQPVPTERELERIERDILARQEERRRQTQAPREPLGEETGFPGTDRGLPAAPSVTDERQGRDINVRRPDQRLPPGGDPDGHTLIQDMMEDEIRMDLRERRRIRAAEEEADIEMADHDTETDLEGASVGADESMGADDSTNPDDSMEIEEPRIPDISLEAATEVGQPAITPRASQLILPLSIPPRADTSDIASQPSSFSSDGGASNGPIPRTASDNTLAMTAAASGSRPPAMNLNTRLPNLGALDPLSTQSSPMGTPARGTAADERGHVRRDTIVGRPVNLNLAIPDARRDRDGANSETSDADVDLQTATIHANIIAVQNMQANQQRRLAETQDGQDADLVVAGPDEEGAGVNQLNEEAMAAEQARLDMEAGAPPGQPGAVETPRVPPNTEPTPRQALLAQPTPPADPANPQQPAQIIIANGAPRGFNDLGSYVGISSILNPEGDQYSDDAILLSLQLLAYLSKYPHVRSTFHHPHRPMHPTFDLTTGTDTHPLPQRPLVSQTANVFSLVERFTFRPSPSDPRMFRIPAEIQYWAGVIMRNACRKDEASGGIRQCANMSCGKWETYPREFAKCRRCRKAKYCSKDCQSKAWSEGHKFWCSVRNDNEAGAPPPAGSYPPGGGDGPGGGDDDDDDMDGDAPRFGGGPGATAGGDQRQRERRQQGHGAGRYIGHAFSADAQDEPIRGGAEQSYEPVLPADTQMDLLRQTTGSRQRMRTEARHFGTSPLRSSFTIPDDFVGQHSNTNPLSHIPPYAPNPQTSPIPSSSRQAERISPQSRLNDWMIPTSARTLLTNQNQRQ